MLRLCAIALALFAAAGAAPITKTTHRPPANATRPHRSRGTRPPRPPPTTGAGTATASTSEPNNGFRTETESTGDVSVTMPVTADESSANYGGFTQTSGEAVAQETTQTMRSDGDTTGRSFVQNETATRATMFGSNLPVIETTQRRLEGGGGEREIVDAIEQRERNAPVENIHVNETGTHSAVGTHGAVENTLPERHAAAPAKPLAAAAQAPSTTDPVTAAAPSPPTAAFTIPPTASGSSTSATMSTTTSTTTIPSTSTTRATSTTTSTVASSSSSTKTTTPSASTATTSTAHRARSTVTPHPVGTFTEPNPDASEPLHFAADWAAELAASPALAAIIGGILLAGALAAAGIVYQGVGVRRRVKVKTPDTVSETELYHAPSKMSFTAPPMPASASD